jgi:hypothetical protein
MRSLVSVSDVANRSSVAAQSDSQILTNLSSGSTITFEEFAALPRLSHDHLRGMTLDQAGKPCLDAAGSESLQNQMRDDTMMPQTAFVSR